MSSKINILLNGCSGKMGRAVAQCVNEREDCKIVAGIDKIASVDLGFPIFESFEQFKGNADVIIDFSHPGAIPALLEYAKQKKTPVIIATTGLSEEEQALIHEVSKVIPVFFSANMSIGVSLLTQLAKMATKVLGGSFDIEIVEMHHNQKIDAPSGTALMLANAIEEELSEKPDFVFERHSKRVKRGKNEIGVHAVRGGTVTGEHEIIFAGHDEIVSLRHSAGSKQIFAAGAVNAAMFLIGKEPGMYNMSDLVSQ